MKKLFTTARRLEKKLATKTASYRDGQRGAGPEPEGPDMVISQMPWLGPGPGPEVVELEKPDNWSAVTLISNYIKKVVESNNKESLPIVKVILDGDDVGYFVYDRHKAEYVKAGNVIPEIKASAAEVFESISVK